MIIHERTLKDVLTPAYHWLFVIMGRLEGGVKFLVDLRNDVLVSELKDFRCKMDTTSCFVSINTRLYGDIFVH